MTNGKDCTGLNVGLAAVSIALLISVCLNIFLFSLRRKNRQSKEVDVSLYQDYFQSVRFDDEEQHNQDNPIYGNIFVDGGVGSMPKPEYEENEQSPNRATRQDEKSGPEDVSYASLDLRLFKKHKKKKRYQEKQKQTHMVQTHPAHGQQMRSTEMRADCDGLPSRTSSLIVSRSSIYLNSHQVALETEELQRKRERERETEWKSIHEWELMKLHGTVDQSLGQNETSYDQDS